MDASKIKAMLNDRAEAVCAHLLPGGKKNGADWCVGDLNNTPGQSLRICISGAKVGVWADFAPPTGQPKVSGNNLLDLWMNVRCPGNFKQALEEAKKYLGVADSNWVRASGNTKPAAQQVDLKSEYEPLREGSPVHEWLTKTRKLDPKALAAYGIGERNRKDQEGNQRHCVVFPYFDEAGTLVMIKYRDVNDKKFMKTWPAGAKKLLFGIQAIHQDQTDLFVTEGELDAIALHQYGIPAVSIPFGAQPKSAREKSVHDEWIENSHDWLDRFLEIYLWMDPDKDGKGALDMIVPRLGRHRVRVVVPPDGVKDANDALKQGVTSREISDTMLAARHLDPERLKQPTNFRDEIWNEFYPSNDEPLGDPTPWALPFRFRPGQLTIWQGYTSGGKTVCQTYVFMHLAAKFQRRTCIASLEIPARKTFKNIARQAMGQAKPADEAELDRVLRWMDQSFWVYDHVGEVRVDELLDVFEYAARKYGIHHFAVDSLMKISDVTTEDYDAQKALVSRLFDYANEFGVHVHLVAHSKKPDSRKPAEKHWPSKYDISGSATLANIPDNIVCVWRNVKKEQELEAIGVTLDEETEMRRQNLLMEEDALFIVQKQRETGAEPIKRLWFDAGDEGSWQYREDAKDVKSVRYAQ